MDPKVQAVSGSESQKMSDCPRCLHSFCTECQVPIPHHLHRCSPCMDKFEDSILDQGSQEVKAAKKPVWHKVALAAYYKGYRVTSEGVLLSPTGAMMSNAARKSDQGYPRFGVYLEDEKRAVRIPVHKFAALCFYGLKTFSSDCVRHMNDDRADFSRVNIQLGSNSDNMQDRCPEQRKKIASAAGKASAAARKKQSNE